ncbi:copper resistance protein B [Alteripontixanthobacter maritimus]
MPAQELSDCEAEAARHRAMGHPVPAGQCAPASAEDVPQRSVDTNAECEAEAARHRAMGHPVPPNQCAPDQAPQTVQVAADAVTECEAEAARHRAMGHTVPADSCEPMENGEMDMGTADAPMDHAAMGHSMWGHASDTAIPSGPPPAAAGAGPPRAADAIWGAEAMRDSRKALAQENGGMKTLWFQGDRLEYRAREGRDGYLWDVQGYYGSDLDKFWFKSEGEGSFGEEIEGAEVQALYSRAIAPFFDLQTGIRQDFAPIDRTYAVVGIQGLAPYLFEVDAAAFLSDQGDLTARIEVELDQKITQRLVLQPRAEINLAAQDVPEVGIGAGLDTIEAGLRLRYEFAREFAPYIGIEQEWKVDGSADYARMTGEDPSVTNYVVGLRFWF